MIDSKTSKMLVVFGQLQSLLHSIEHLQESGIKQELKQKVNNFHSWLEPIVEKTTVGITYENGGNTLLTFTNVLDNVSREFEEILNELNT